MAYTIEAITGNKPWAGQHGPMMSYYLTLVDAQGQKTENVELGQKPSSPAPQPGQTLEGNIDQGKFGPKFKKAFSQGFSGGGGGGYKGKSPSEQASIAASVALDKALIAVEQGATLGVVKISSPEEHAAAIDRYFAHFFRLIDAKGKAAA